MSRDAAIQRMRELRGVHFDPAVVDALLDVLAQEREAHVQRA
jgi:HD-GYP domain-containing protein (c-di-GMP phosphodiesterase class II)